MCIYMYIWKLSQIAFKRRLEKEIVIGRVVLLVQKFYSKMAVCKFEINFGFRGLHSNYAMKSTVDVFNLELDSVQLFGRQHRIMSH